MNKENDPVKIFREVSLVYVKSAIIITGLVSYMQTVLQVHNEMGEILLKLMDSMPQDIREKLKTMGENLKDGETTPENLNDILNDLLDQNDKGELN